MNDILQEILEKCQVPLTDGSKPTHITFFGPRKEWFIDASHMSTLWSDYCSLVDREKDTDFCNLCLAEVNIRYSPVIIIGKLTFSYSETSVDTFQFYRQIVKCYQQSIRECLEISDDHKQLICIVLESKIPIKKGDILYYNFRVQFPFCIVDSDFQEKVLHPHATELIRKVNIYKYLVRSPVGDWNDTVEPNICRNPIPLYGSVNSQGENRLIVQALFREITDRLDDSDDENSSDEEDPDMISPSTFDPSVHSYFRRGYFRPGFLTETPTTDPYYWFPLVLSLYYWDTVSHPNDVMSRKITHVPSEPKLENPIDRFEEEEIPRRRKKKKSSDDDDPHTINLEKIATDLLPYLHKERATEYHYFCDVGKAIYSSFKGSEDGFELWFRWACQHHNIKYYPLTESEEPSRKEVEGSSSKESHSIGYFELSRDLAQKLWAFFSDNNNITVQTIIFYVKKDNNDIYNKWAKRFYFPAIDLAIKSPSNQDLVSNAIYRLFWIDFACAGVGENKWYQFQDHHWVASDHASELRYQITRYFCKILNQYRVKIINDMDTEEENDPKEEERLKSIAKIVTNLGKSSFLEAVVKYCRDKFYSFRGIRFAENIDQSKFLLGINNGVIEVVNHDFSNKIYAFFREGKPEDYICIHSNTPYIDYSWDHPHVKSLLFWLHQVFCNSNLEESFLRYASTGLRAGNFIKKFPVWEGKTANNGKSTLIKLFQKTFGHYCVELPTSLITGQRTQSSGHTEELARLTYARFAFLKETDNDTEKSNAGIIKGLTGDDKMYCRGIRKEAGEIEIASKLILICNVMIPIPSIDRAIKNRLRIFPFNSIWASYDKVKPTMEEQFAERVFLDDINFSQKLGDLAKAFLWICVQKYHITIAEGLNECEEMMSATESYWKRTDTYGIFCSSRLEKSPDPLEILTLDQVYREFKDWYQSYYPKIRIPDCPIFQERISAILGPTKTNSWRGVRIHDRFQSGGSSA